MSPGRRLAAFCMASMLAASGHAFAQEPQQVVQALYSEQNLTFAPSHSAAYFARDLDTALKIDAGNPQQVGAVDFDYRYGAQENDVSGLELLPEIDNDQARVVAVFKNFGKANSVEWTLCRRANGDWRILNAGSNTGSEAWDLRRMLKLPTDRFRC